MSNLSEKMQTAAATMAARTKQAEDARAAALRAALQRRPPLSNDSIMQSLDWVLDNQHVLGPQTQMYMAAIELAIRAMATAAQAKDTQHTLVRDGVIEARPASESAKVAS